jgi:hypothetical protein
VTALLPAKAVQREHSSTVPRWWKELPVPQPKLRLFCGDDAGDSLSSAPSLPDAQTVTVPLADVFPLLAEATRSRRAWLSDFADDQITISQDLYEVIVAYQHYRRPGKAA